MKNGSAANVSKRSHYPSILVKQIWFQPAMSMSTPLNDQKMNLYWNSFNPIALYQIGSQFSKLDALIVSVLSRGLMSFKIRYQIMLAFNTLIFQCIGVYDGTT